MNRALFIAYALPYALYTAVGIIPGDLLDRTGAAALRFGLAGAALAWGWRRYVPLRGPRPAGGSIAVGALAGLAGTALWVALVSPFTSAAGSPWPAPAFALRLAGAVLLVPLVEELLMRGYLLRVIVQRDEAKRAGIEHPLEHTLDACNVGDVPAGAWTTLAVVVSTVLFALGHASHEWVAAVAYGLLMAGLWILRKDLLTCVVAHAVTNLALAIYVYRGGHWELW